MKAVFDINTSDAGPLDIRRVCGPRFNTFNSEHYSNPDGDFNDGTFGQITEDIGSSNRVAQIAGKIIF